MSCARYCWWLQDSREPWPYRGLLPFYREVVDAFGASRTYLRRRVPVRARLHHVRGCHALARYLAVRPPRRARDDPRRHGTAGVAAARFPHGYERLHGRPRHDGPVAFRDTGDATRLRAAYSRRPPFRADTGIRQAARLPQRHHRLKRNASRPGDRCGRRRQPERTALRHEHGGARARQARAVGDSLSV